MSISRLLVSGCAVFLLLSLALSVQAVTVLNETFDSDSAFLKSNASGPSMFFRDEEDTDEYWGINDPTGNGDDYDGAPAPNSGWIPPYTGFSGKFLNGEDLNAQSEMEALRLDWSNLDISGMSSLMFSGLFAARGDFEDGVNPDGDYIKVQYRIDSDTSEFLDVIWFTPESAASEPDRLRVDDNFDGIGTGIALSTAAQSFMAPIPGMGSTLDFRIKMVSDGLEELAFDTLTITGSAAVYRLANPTAHTPEPINFGNFHVGDAAPSQALSLTNDVPNDGFSEALNASIGSPTGGVTTNSGSFSLLAPGATNNSSLVVGIGTATAGNMSGTATITLASDGTGSSGSGQTPLSSQTVNVTGSVYRLASATAHTPEPVNFGHFHVGDVAPSQALSLTNNGPNDGFSEALNASIGSPTGGVTTNSGSFSLLAPGATNNSSLVVGISTATAGNKAGTATVSLTSNGTGSSELGLTPLSAQTVNVTGRVFRLASASPHTPEPVNFGILHVGDPVPSRLLTLTNTAASDGFSERLNATIGTATGAATTNNGAFNGLAPGGTNNTSLSVGINTSSAGNKSGTATIALTSNGTGTSGLGNTPLASQIVNVSATINNYAVADIVKLSGDGTFTMIAANEFSLDLGSTLRGSADLAAELGVVNDVAAPADTLAGDFMVTAADFVTSGFRPFTGLSAGSTLQGLSIELDSGTVGTFDGQIVLQPRSTNPSPFTVNLPAITIHLTGEVRLPGDYNFDGVVDAADYLVWRKTLDTSVPPGSGADGDGSGMINQNDLAVWRANFGEVAGSGAGAGAAVPEPATAVLLLVGMLMMIFRRREGVS